MSLWQLEYLNKRLAELKQSIEKFQRQMKMDRTAWVEEANQESGGAWKYDSSSFYPAMLGRAEHVISNVVYQLGSNWDDMVKEVTEICRKADDYDEILGDLDDDDLRKLKVLMTRGDRYDQRKLRSVITESLGCVSDMEYEEAARAVDGVFTEDEDSGGVRWTRGESEEITLNSKREEFTYMSGSEVKVLKYHEVPAFCLTLKEAVAA